MIMIAVILAALVVIGILLMCIAEQVEQMKNLEERIDCLSDRLMVKSKEFIELKRKTTINVRG